MESSRGEENYQCTVVQSREKANVVLKEQIFNVQRRKMTLEKQQNNSTNTCATLQGQLQNPTLSLQEAVVGQNGDVIQQPLLSVDVSAIDERDDLLLSTSTIQTQLLIDDNHEMCKLHEKSEDIICMVEKVKICCYCALFGHHKDHTIKSEQQLTSEIDKKTKQLMQLEQSFLKLNNSVRDKKQLRQLQQFCEQKKKDSLKEIQQQYNQILYQINEAKREAVKSIEEQHRTILKKIKNKWEQCQIDISDSKLFKDWKLCGLEIIKRLKMTLPTSDIGQSCSSYQDFPWGKGESLIKQANNKIQQFSRSCKNQIQCLVSSNEFKSSLAIALNFESQNIVSLHPVPSIQELHHISSQIQEPVRQVETCQQFSESKEKPKFRHSELLESSLKPIRQSLQQNPRETRNSTYGLSKMRKSQIGSNNQWNFSTLMNRSKSNLRNDQTFLSPKLKASNCRSPRHSAVKPNPLKIMAEYEKNIAQSTLNFSNCGLNDQSLQYFIHKAFNSHVPYEVNLNKNSISQSGLAKLMPYLLKVKSVNLACTGLGEECLQVFLKAKGTRYLQEVNILQNGISLHKNRVKIQTLKKMGLKIICQ